MPDPFLIAIIFVSALVQGYGGFGFGIVAVALAGLLAGPLASAAAVITACSLPPGRQPLHSIGRRQASTSR